MDLLQTRQCVATSIDAPSQQEPEIAETPRDQTEAGDAEERVQDLRVDFDPDAACGVDVVAGGGTHRGGGVAEEEEEHAAPADDVEHVDCDEEALGGCQRCGVSPGRGGKGGRG